MSFKSLSCLSTFFSPFSYIHDVVVVLEEDWIAGMLQWLFHTLCMRQFEISGSMNKSSLSAALYYPAVGFRHARPCHNEWWQININTNLS